MSKNEQEFQNNSAFDYDREPPLDRTTTRINRSRSKYVFTTLCFLLALILLCSFINGWTTGDSSNWFPLVGAVVLAIMGVVFLRSSDEPPVESRAIDEVEENAPAVANAEEMQLSDFEKLVQEALSSLPDEFQAQMENVALAVAFEPEPEVLERLHVDAGHILLGLYEGTPMTAYSHYHASYPELITIYQKPIEIYCQHDPRRMREQVRSTVLHEVAHHFGMGHEEMPIWLK